MKRAGKLAVISWAFAAGVFFVGFALFRLGGPLPPADEFRRTLERELSRMGLQHLGRREVLSYSNGRLRTKVAIAFDLYDDPSRSHRFYRVKRLTMQAMQAVIKALADNGCNPRSQEVDILVKVRQWTPPSPTGRREAMIAGVARYDHESDQVTFSYGDYHRMEAPETE